MVLNNLFSTQTTQKDFASCKEIFFDFYSEIGDLIGNIGTIEILENYGGTSIEYA